MTIKISDDRVKCQSLLTFSHSHSQLAMAHSQETPASDRPGHKKYAKRERQRQTCQSTQHLIDLATMDIQI